MFFVANGIRHSWMWLSWIYLAMEKQSCMHHLCSDVTWVNNPWNTYNDNDFHELCTIALVGATMFIRSLPLSCMYFPGLSSPSVTSTTHKIPQMTSVTTMTLGTYDIEQRISDLASLYLYFFQWQVFIILSKTCYRNSSVFLLACGPLQTWMQPVCLLSKSEAMAYDLCDNSINPMYFGWWILSPIIPMWTSLNFN